VVSDIGLVIIIIEGEDCGAPYVVYWF